MINELLTSAGVNPKTALRFAPLYEKQFPIFGVTSAIEICHFLAQVLHESGNLYYMREIWGPTAQQMKYERDFKKPWDKRQLAFRLGNTNVGDGRRYMGRGGIQRTGRYNMFLLTKKLNVDFISNPTLLEQPEYAVLSDLTYWIDHGCSRIAKGDDRGTTTKFGKIYNTALVYVTKKINPGLKGLAERQEKFDVLLAAMRRIADLKSVEEYQKHLFVPSEVDPDKTQQ